LLILLMSTALVSVFVASRQLRHTALALRDGNPPPST
jgi:hypothetical protein